MSEPRGCAFPFQALLGMMGARLLRGREAFVASCLFNVGMPTSAAFGVFPYVLPAFGDPAHGLTIYSTAAAPYGLRVGLFWFVPGMLLAIRYFVYAYRNFSGKVRLDEAGY